MSDYKIKSGTTTTSGEYRLVVADAARAYLNNDINCCGQSILGGFDITFFKENPESITLLQQLLNTGKRSCTIATIIDRQVEIMQPILEELGFKEVDSFINKNTGNLVHILTKKGE